jgi:hypothetical protein
MEKIVFYDANKIKWVIELDPRNGMYWGHVDGDNEEFSGEVGNTIGSVFEELAEDGYMEE